MAHTALRLPLSQRSRILWDLHCALDEVQGGWSWTRRARFAKRVIARFGVQGSAAGSGARALKAWLPADLDDLELGSLLDALETIVPFAWHDDRVHVPARLRAELVDGCTRILEHVARPSFPKVVTADILRMTREVLGEDVLAQVDLSERLEAVLVSDLWRCQGEERVLAERIVDDIETAAKLAFG